MHKENLRNYEDEGNGFDFSSAEGPYSRLRPQSTARLSRSWNPRNTAATSLFHCDLTSDVNVRGLILVAAGGGAWTRVGVSTKRTLKACKLGRRFN